LLQGRIRAISDLLTEKLDAGKVAVRLFQLHVLNARELQDIQTLSNKQSTKAADKLLKKVLLEAENFRDCFLDSLIQTDQLDVHRWIVLGLFMSHNACDRNIFMFLTFLSVHCNTWH